MTNRFYLGDSRDVLPTIKETIALAVTSPPYLVGRKYEEYIRDEKDYWGLLDNVFALTKGLLEPNGKLAVNFADRYANSAILGHPLEILYSTYYDVMMHKIGLDLWARVIWDKVRVMIDGARHTTNKGRFEGDMRVAPNWEYIYVWRNYIPKFRAPAKEIDMTKEEWREWVDSIWQFSSVTKNERLPDIGKLAKFPYDLPYRLIKMYTQKGDWILDQFAGTCTTMRAAHNTGRNCICVEKSPAIFEYTLGKLQKDDIPVEVIT